MFPYVCRCALLWFTVYTFYTIADESSNSPLLCSPATNCSECLLQGPQCTWCVKNGYKNSDRCDTAEGHEKKGCGDLSIVNPSSRTQYKQNVSVRNADLNLKIPAVQISPQSLDVRLSPGRSVKVPITFRIAEDYPVDLYYIMDMSFSMLDDQGNLIRLGEALATELKQISKDVRIGFGAFVDKPVMPFIGTRESAINNPCAPRGLCEAAYGFINQLSLTSNTSIFADRVRATPISGNQDGPEGGFDALMQSMVCTKKIGWREDSRKIILFSTDARTHIAADSKLAGIVEPNDGHCHMTQNKYTYSDKQDYPSISQIADIASITSTSIIFAVASNEAEYRLISNEIPNSVVGPLAEDSSNIVSLVRNEYNNLIKTVRLAPVGLPSDVKVILRTNCSSFNGEMIEGDVCDSARIGQYIHFEAEISIEKCSSNGNYQFAIKPQDLSESVRIQLQIACQCDCGDQVEESNKCSGVGTHRCGICECNQGYGGERCECDNSVQQSKDSCVNPFTNAVCSIHGECNSCANCVCDCLPGGQEPNCERYSGQYCECNNKQCPARNGLLCSGKGDCVCDPGSSNSYCKCKSGYLGQDCSCPISDFTCRANNGTGEVCSGKGECECGKCQCTDACYSGPTCSILKPECSRACISFKECVICRVKPLESPTICVSNGPCAAYDIRMVSQLDTDGSCFYEDAEGCRHHYRFEYNHSNATWVVSVLNEPKCQKDYWLEVIIGVCVGVLLLGILALIIWKRIVTIHDNKALAEFEKEVQQAKWKSTHNPIYKPATSTFRNPMYHKPESVESLEENEKTHLS